MTQSTSLSPRLRARFFGSLAEASRLAILEALRGGPRTVGEVALAAGLTASTASRHLACLRDGGLVTACHEWRTVRYALADGVAAFLDETDRFIADVAERIASCDRPEMAP